MLNDLKLIHERDAQDALGIAEKQGQQLEATFDVAALAPQTFANVVVAGMGGSALSSLIAQAWPGFDVPFEIVRDYVLPRYVSDSSLVIVSSYSGNTEETISALADAEQKHARIVVLSSGGKLADIAKAKNYPLVLLPSGLQPRYATFSSYKALVTITDALGVSHGAAAELVGKTDFLRQAIAGWVPTVATTQNQAKQIAQECIGKSVVVYSGPLLHAAAYNWKISFNENAKQLAWLNQYPEFNHNEFIGWTKQPITKPYTVIEIRSSLEHPEIQKRFTITARLLSGVRPEPLVVEPQGQDVLEQLLWSIVLGDFVSLYVAILNGINPTPVDIVEKLKQALVA